ncbi:hypothetical protein AB0J82_36910 [Asanoa sp. NPDC049518]|uniref:hypothetical protein n=1 Tax=unclassified Asanoa TaxID=2685164 RepID=UPI00341EBCE2
MRRLVGAVMMGLVVLGAAACGSDGGKADAAAPSSSAAAPSATAGGSDGTEAACREAVEMGEAATKVFTTKTEELQALAISGGEDKTACA